MNKTIFEEIEKLFELNDVLIEKAHNLYYKGGFKESLFELNNNQQFSKYKRNTYKEILEFKGVVVNNEIVLELLGLRCKMLKSCIASLSLNNLGTSLNISREIWNDVLIDLKRHSINRPSNKPLF
jgi:hypothetical protein